MPIELIQISNQNIEEIIKTEQQGNITINGYDQNDDTIKTKNLGNVSENWRDEFSNFNSLEKEWIINKDADDEIVMVGNTDGSSYLSVIKNYRKINTKTEIISKKSFTLPTRATIAVSSSLRFEGTDFDIDMVSIDDNNEIEILNPIVEFGVESISIVSSNWTIVCKQDITDSLFTNDSIIIYNADNSSLNIGPVQITITGKNSFVFNRTATNANFNASVGQLGNSCMIRKLDALNRSVDGFGFSLEGSGISNVSNVRLTSRNNNATYSELRTDTSFRDFGLGVSNVLYKDRPYTFSIKPNRIMEMSLNSRSITWNVFNESSASQSILTLKKHMPLPNLDKKYILRFSFDCLMNFYVSHVADIQNITKTNLSQTVTVVTKTPHNLKIGNQIFWSGITSASSEFNNLNPNIAVTVQSIIDQNTFTYQQSVASTITISANDGSVFLVNGTKIPSTTIPFIGLKFLNYEINNNILTAVSSTSSGINTYNVGLHYQFFGIKNEEIEKTFWRCVEISGATVRFMPIKGVFQNISLTNTNFTIANSLEFRLHLAQIQSYKRNLVEISNSWGNSRDADESMGVNIVNVPAVSLSSNLPGITNPVFTNSFIQSTVSAGVFAYTTPILANSSVFAFNTNLTSATGISRNKLNAIVLSDVPIIAQIEYSVDNITWFSIENPTIAKGVIYPFYNYTTVTNITPTITMTVGSPGIINHNAHGFQAGAPVIFSTTGVLPTGISRDIVYYIRPLNTNQYHIYNTFENSMANDSITTGRINFSGTQSGTHSISNLRQLGSPMGNAFLPGTNVNITNIGPAQVYATSATQFNVAASSISVPANGNISVPDNTVFRASILESILSGSFFRLRLVNPTSNQTKMIYATLNQLTL